MGTSHSNIRMTRSRLLSLLTLMLSFVSAGDSIAASVQAYIQPPRARPNEVVTYVITVRDGVPNGVPALRLPPQIGQTTGSQVSQRLEIVNGRQSMNVQFSWGIAAHEPGEFVIAPQQIIVDGQPMMTNEVRFFVESGGTQNQSAANDENPMMPRLEISLEKNEFYVGEVLPITAQLLVPRGAPGAVGVRRTGLIEMEKDDFAISRFPQQSEQTVVRIGNVDHVSLTYRSTISALREGDLSVGPATMDLVVDVEVADQRSPFGGAFQGFFGRSTESRNLTVTSGEIPIKVLPLPSEGKPANFSGAVGDFSISASVSPDTVKVGEPITVEILVGGRGNFDALNTPALSDPEAWKSYPPRKYNADGIVDQSSQPSIERRIGFSLVLVPEAVHPELPPFELNYFSPTKGEYVILRTAPFPLTITAAPGSPASPDSEVAIASESAVPKAIPVSMPRADITDILTQVPTTATWITPGRVALIRQPAFWAAQAIPLSMWIGACIWAMSQRRKAELSKGRAGRLRALWSDLENAGKNDAKFLRLGSQLIFAAHRDQPVTDPKLQEILRRYEEGSFSGDPNASLSLTSTERSTYRRSLSTLLPGKKTAPTKPQITPTAAGALSAGIALCLCTATASLADTPDELFEEARTSLEAGDFLKAQYKAETLLKQEPPAISSEGFQILGHARYRQEDPGQAVLQYDRALLLDPRAPEIRQNLRHLEAQLRYLTFPPSSPLVGWSTLLTLNEWTLLTAAGAWLILIGLTLRAILRGRSNGPSKQARLLTGISVFTGFLIIIPAATFLALRPAASERVKDIAIVTAQDNRAFSAATRTAGTVTDLPPGSQVRLLETRGAWAYVEIPDAIEPLRGWVEAISITPLWPWSPKFLP